MKFPIPEAALDDILAFVGTTGSGKTYAAGTAVERLLSGKARVVIVDPLDVWFGLRLAADGGSEAFPVVIFGGARGDLALTENSGAVIGETVAGMAESCIVSTAALATKAAERRFMLAFLTALYRNTSGSLVHLIFDEADMWAPQVLGDRDGDAARLLGQMETIVRRGRVKGFIPWLITQRPAVLNKNVLDMAHGMVAMKLTGPHDRKALGGWINGQADKAEEKRILGRLPELQRGQAMVWIPGRGILSEESFPKKATFDSSRAPARGQKAARVAPRPLDLAGLQARLSTVEEETKANDPKALRAQLAALKRQMAEGVARKLVAEPADGDAALRAEVERLGKAIAQGTEDAKGAEREEFERGYDRAVRDAASWHAPVLQRIGDAVKALRDCPLHGLSEAAQNIAGDIDREVETLHKRWADGHPAMSAVTAIARERLLRPAAPTIARPAPARVSVSPPINEKKNGSDAPAADGATALTNPQRSLLRSLAWWRAMGHDEPTRPQVAAIAGWAPSGSNLRNRLSELSRFGLVDYPREGVVRLTPPGIAAAPDPDTGRTLIDSVRAMLTAPQAMLFDALLAGDLAVSRDALAAAVGWEAGGSNLRNRLSELSGLELVDYPSRGVVALQAWVTA